MNDGFVHQVNVSPGGVPKTAIADGVVTPLGIEGDKQAKPGIHGGPYRAVCLFPLEEIERLAADGHPISPGSIGENITTVGLDWTKVLPNARLRIGTDVALEITGYADPCQAIAGSFLRGDINLVNVRVASSSRVYARVTAPGTIRAGDAIGIESAGDADQPQLAEAGVRTITQVSVAVSDLNRSVAFYSEALGARHVRTVGEWGLAFLDVDGIGLMLEGPRHGGAVVPNATTICFGVEDIDGSFNAMTARGVPFDAPPLLQYEEDGVQGWMAFLRDPDGNRLALVCRVPVVRAD